MKLSQADEILTALKSHPEGLHPTYFIESLHIFQYSARIHELRTRFGCTHKNSNTVCFANEHLINKDLQNGTTLFIYNRKNIVDWKKMREETVEKINGTEKSSLQIELL